MQESILGNLTATKEVLVAAGVIGTPQLMLNSGIGDPQDLNEVEVPVVHALPDVGKNMHNQPEARTLWTYRDPTPPINRTLALEQWTRNRTGPLSEGGVAHLVLWARFPPSSSLWKDYPDPSSGPYTAHAEIVLAILGNEVGALVGLMSPTSRGCVTIRSNNPFDEPIVDPGLLKTQYDLLALKESVRISKQFFSGAEFSSNGYLLNASFVDPEEVSDTEWEACIRNTVNPKFHGVGTASISKVGDRRGVVDPDLRVKGVTGLRIVDASIIPEVPAGHTQVPSYIVGERAADLIKALWT
ncbi:hypothetical protein H1R20_g12332, partial [Candolleomyces eurysporus]